MQIKNFLWLLLLAAMWGPSFLFIKVAVRDVPPFTLACTRVGVAAIILYIILRLSKRRMPAFGPIWKHFAFIGLVSSAVPFTLFSWGEIYIDSALASILNGTTPLFTIVIAHMFTKDDRLSSAKIIGSIIGFGGLVLLVAPSFWGGVKATTWGLLAVTGAAFCYGISVVYTRLYLLGLPKLVAPTAQLGVAAVYLLPLSLIFEQPFSLPMPSPESLGSMLALAILGSVLAYIVYYDLIERVSASYISMVTYLVPIFGVILGIVVLDERLTWNAYIGCAFILLGVMVVNGLLTFKIPFTKSKLVKEKPVDL